MTTRPNILLIIADQLAWKALPIHGNRCVSTPNIDRLGARSAHFSRCYASVPLCQPSRASFWTGRFPHETGVLSNGRKFPQPPIPQDMPTLGSLFSAAGYDCAHFGKTHDAGSLRGFRCQPVQELPVEGTAAWPVNYDTRQDRYATAEIVKYLRGNPSQPFLAVADLNNPHDICNWVGHHQGRHEDKSVPGILPPLPENFRDADFEKRPLPVQYICCSHNRQSQAAGWNETNHRHYLAAYNHYISRLDAEIGLILDALESRPDADNTLVIFTADHGDGMAAHGLVTKQVSLYEETTRVPFMACGPGIHGGGRMLDAPLTSLMDLLPTLCGFAGIAPPTGIWGRSLLPWLRGERNDSPHAHVVSEWHTEWGFTIEPGRMLRTDRYKYIRYLEGDGEEFYDLRHDPGETHTLTDDPVHAAELEKHRALLKKHLEQTRDPFFSLSPLVAPRWRSHPPGHHHHAGPAAPMVE